jgi:hypothetical protein
MIEADAAPIERRRQSGGRRLAEGRGGRTRPMCSLQSPSCAHLDCPSDPVMVEKGILPARHSRMNALY